ncbi:MAG: hypothetical protein JXQ90_08475 [Cyclobacteriaceae bacterium]
MTGRILNYSITILLLGSISCNTPTEKNSVRENEIRLEIESSKQVVLSMTQGSQSDDNVHCSLQDASGNLWFGTTGEGMYKFDGNSFEQFTSSDGLPSNVVFCLLEDNRGKIWIGTDNGISIYDGQSFVDVPIADPVNSVHDRMYVFSIMQDKKGRIWFATVEGVYVYDGKSFTSFRISEDGPGFMSRKHNVEYILEGAAGDIWFGGRVNKGVYRFDGDTIINYPLEPLAEHDWARPALLDSKGNIWFSNWGGVYRFDGQLFMSFTKRDGLINGGITSIMEDNNQNIWFGSEQAGICRFDRQTFTHFSTKNGLMNSSVWTLLEDKDQNIWVGTRNLGLYRLNEKMVIDYSQNKTSFQKGW